jgi:uncharacterized membrane protein
MLTVPLGIRLAIHAGLVSQAWLPAGRRAVGLLLALGMVLFGNALPTLRSPWPYPDQPFAWQQVHRFVGWTFVIGGLVVGGCWTLLLPDDAHQATIPTLVVVMVLTLARKLTSVATHAGRSLAR